VHLVGFIVRIHHDARCSEYKMEMHRNGLFVSSKFLKNLRGGLLCYLVGVRFSLCNNQFHHYDTCPVPLFVSETKAATALGEKTMY
jgi:hypothetical protein